MRDSLGVVWSGNTHEQIASHFFSRWASPVSNQWEEHREKQNHKPLVWNNQTVILKSAREDTLSGGGDYINKNLNFILLSVEFPFQMMWVVSPIGQTNSLPPPQKEKKKCTATISRWSSPQHFHIGILFLSHWFPWETCQFSFIFQFTTASSQPHSLCWIQKRKKRKKKKRLFSRPLGPHANYKPMIWLPNKPCDILIQCRVLTT